MKFFLQLQSSQRSVAAAFCSSEIVVHMFTLLIDISISTSNIVTLYMTEKAQ